MNTVTVQEIVDFTIKQAEAEKLKAFIDKRYELSLDPTNRVDAEPIIQEMLKNMGSNYRLEFTKEANKDRERLADYLEELSTKQRRLVSLAKALQQLKTDWKLHGYYNRSKNIRVNYIDGWYSIFFTVDEQGNSILIVAMLAQSEDLSRLSD